MQALQSNILFVNMNLLWSACICVYLQKLKNDLRILKTPGIPRNFAKKGPELFIDKTQKMIESY